MEEAQVMSEQEVLEKMLFVQSYHQKFEIDFEDQNQNVALDRASADTDEK